MARQAWEKLLSSQEVNPSLAETREIVRIGGLIQAKTGHEKAAQTAQSHIVYKSY